MKTAPSQQRLAKLYSGVTLLGPPLGEPLSRLVDHLFDPDEAELAIHLPLYLPKPIEEIGRRCGREVEAIQPLLDGMADRAVIFKGYGGYSLLPILPGMFEFVMIGGGDDEWYRRYARLFLDLVATGYVDDYTGTRLPAVRTITDTKSFRKRTHVVDDDLMEEMLQAHDEFGVLNACACRHANALVGIQCQQASPEDGCLSFGSFGRGSGGRGTARSVTRDEMRAIIDERRRKKLVFLTANVEPSSPNIICTCCECCCHLLAVVNDHGARGWVAPPKYIVEVDRDRCEHCGLCKPACSTRAFTVTKKVHSYEPSRCIGCGNCIDVCQTGALKLVPYKPYRRPPKNFKKLMLKLLPAVGLVLARAKMARWA